MLAANPNDVRVFATQDELIQAYNNQELRLGSLVVINGEVKAVTQDMVGGNLSQNAADVRVFTTQGELNKALENQEIKVGTPVIVEGKPVTVTESMIFMAN